MGLGSSCEFRTCCDSSKPPLSKGHEEMSHEWALLVRSAAVPSIRGFLEVKPDDVNLELNANGRTALHEAAQNNDLEMAKLLIAHSIKLDSQLIDSGQTALHIAACENYESICELLCFSGANPHVCDWKGRSPHNFTDSYNILAILCDARRKYTKREIDSGKIIGHTPFGRLESALPMRAAMRRRVRRRETDGMFEDDEREQFIHAHSPRNGYKSAPSDFTMLRSDEYSSDFHKITGVSVMDLSSLWRCMLASDASKSEETIWLAVERRLPLVMTKSTGRPLNTATLPVIIAALSSIVLRKRKRKWNRIWEGTAAMDTLCSVLSAIAIHELRLKADEETWQCDFSEFVKSGAIWLQLTVIKLSEVEFMQKSIKESAKMSSMIAAKSS